MNRNASDVTTLATVLRAGVPVNISLIDLKVEEGCRVSSAASSLI
jgi:hypothetical protein